MESTGRKIICKYPAFIAQLAVSACDKNIFMGYQLTSSVKDDSQNYILRIAAPGGAGPFLKSPACFAVFAN